MGCYYGQEAGVLTRGPGQPGAPEGDMPAAPGTDFCWCGSSLLEIAFRPGFRRLATFASGEPGRSVDWRDGADLYKAWAVEQPWCRRLPSAVINLPGWLKSGPAWCGSRGVA